MHQRLKIRITRHQQIRVLKIQAQMDLSTLVPSPSSQLGNKTDPRKNVSHIFHVFLFFILFYVMCEFHS